MQGSLDEVALVSGEGVWILNMELDEEGGTLDIGVALEPVERVDG